MLLSPVNDIELLKRPIRLGPVELGNRMCMPAMHLNFTPSGEVTASLLAFYEERARGGVAMITVGGCAVEPGGGGPLMMAIHDDRFIPGLSRLASTIAAGGAVPVAQLYHAGRYAVEKYTGSTPIAPSSVRSTLTGETPRALALDEIPAVQELFVRAAVRAIEAGFRGVEVLASAGYLISQFLSPVTNRREDEYGGDFDRRMRFGRELVQRVRQAIGPQHLLLVRMGGADFVPGGLTNAESAHCCQEFEAAGADGINVTGGWHETHVPQLTMDVPRGAFLYLARGVRQVVKVPVIASNRLSDPLIAEAALRDGICDLVNFGRTLIADPELPRKVLEDRLDEITHCVGCNQGCMDHVFAGQPVRCMVNPRAGREGHVVARAARTRNVTVVGGGPAGMMAAITAAQRGHEVYLVERGAELGGQLLLAGQVPGRREFATLQEDLVRKVRALPISVALGVTATPELIRVNRPDVVILATGATPTTPPLGGVNLPHVVQAWEVLCGRARVGRQVVVIGGGPVAVDVAIELAQRGTLDGETLRFLLISRAEPMERLEACCIKGTHAITLVEADSTIGRKIGRTTRWNLMQQLKRFGVNMLDHTSAQRIDAGGVWVESNQEAHHLAADTVVLAVGAAPDRTLADALSGTTEVVLVGDVREPRRAFEAIHEGFEAAMQI